MKFTWEEIFNKYNFDTCGKKLKTARAKVLGGWLVLHMQIQRVNNEIIKSESMTFLPDKDHEWSLSD